MEKLDYLRQLSFWSVLLRMGLAVFFGGMIGMERGRKRRAAGFRTYMLVCLGAALTSLLSQYYFVRFATDWTQILATTGKQVDVSRLGAKVFSGIGFLAAGTIVVTGRQETKGMTTAAGLWASACLGISVGAGFYECAVTAFFLMLLSFRLLPILEAYLLENSRNMNIYAELSAPEDLGALLACVRDLGVRVYDVEFDRGNEGQKCPSVVLSIRLNAPRQHPQVLAALSEVGGVTTIDEI